MVGKYKDKEDKKEEEVSEVTVDKTLFTNLRAVCPRDERAFILFLSGPLKGKMYSLDRRQTVIGRADDATISINDPHISRHHFRITMEGCKAVLEDMGSTNGTFVNGTKVQRKVLENGDKIQISTATIIKFAYGDEGERMFLNEFYEMANYDALTGALNKHAFLRRIKEEVALAQRMRHPLSLIMLDLDFFKKINDTYGHLAGDFVLAEVSRIMHNTVREGDIIARYGGEEFAILLRGIEERGAARLAERLRKNVAGMHIEFDGKRIGVTVSEGVAQLEKGQSVDNLITTADKCLYTSKEAGRNKVTTASELKKQG